MHDLFYLTDLHGRWELFNTMIQYCKKQDSACTIIFGGDACDRGSDGYKIMRTIIDDPQIIYLKGNHEQLFVNAAKYLLSCYVDGIPQFTQEAADEMLRRRLGRLEEPIYIYLQNGGFETLSDWLMDGASKEFVEQIDKLPLTFSYENIDFCHAGAMYPAFERVTAAEYEKNEVDANDTKSLLWDRQSFYYGWASNRICVHGHTPAVFLPAIYYGKDKSENKIHPCYWIGDWNLDKWGGARIDMDTGATFTGRAYLLNILTMNVIGFYDPAITNKKQPHDIHIFEQYNILKQNKMNQK